MQHHHNHSLTPWGDTQPYDAFNAGEAASANITPIHFVQLQPVIHTHPAALRTISRQSPREPAVKAESDSPNAKRFIEIVGSIGTKKTLSVALDLPTVASVDPDTDSDGPQSRGEEDLAAEATVLFANMTYAKADAVSNAEFSTLDESADAQDIAYDPPDVHRLKMDDSLDVKLAKSMFARMMYDLVDVTKPATEERDLFGEVIVKQGKADRAKAQKYDALIWLYAFNPEPPLVPFDWVCEMLGFDPERVRRITARSAAEDLKQVLRFMKSMVSPHHAQICEEKMSDYLNISSWNSFNRH